MYILSVCKLALYHIVLHRCSMDYNIIRARARKAARIRREEVKQWPVGNAILN